MATVSGNGIPNQSRMGVAKRPKENPTALWRTAAAKMVRMTAKAVRRSRPKNERADTLTADTGEPQGEAHDSKHHSQREQKPFYGDGFGLFNFNIRI